MAVGIAAGATWASSGARPPASAAADASTAKRHRREGGKHNAAPYNQDLVLQSGTSSYLRHDGADEKLPDVPGLQNTQGTIAFDVDEKFSLNNAVLLVGNANFNQATVPLGTSGKYVSLE